MNKFLIPVFVAAFGVSSLAFVASSEAGSGCGSFLQTVSTPDPVTTASGESTTPIVVHPSPSG